MKVTEIRITTLGKRAGNPVRAYVIVVFEDCFLVRNIRVIEKDQRVFIAMPSRESTITCSCGYTGGTGKFCCQCGARLPVISQEQSGGSHSRHIDIAHPINAPFRKYLEDAILQKFEEQQTVQDN